MDIASISMFKEILEDLKDVSQGILETSPKQKYKCYMWNSAYIIEDTLTQKTICMHSDFGSLISTAKQKGVNIRDIILEL